MLPIFPDTQVIVNICNNIPNLERIVKNSSPIVEHEITKSDYPKDDIFVDLDYDFIKSMIKEHRVTLDKQTKEEIISNIKVRFLLREMELRKQRSFKLD